MFASIPAIIGTVSTIVTTANALIKAGQDAGPAIDMLKKVFSKDQITEQELQAIQKENDELFAKLDAPLPPEED